MDDWWFGVVAGGGFGALYSFIGVLVNRWALRLPKLKAFLWASVGGMLVRLVVALVVVALVVMYTPIHVAAFIGAFFMVFVLGLALEIAILHRAVKTGGGA